MNYSAEVWGFCKADEIETVHLQFCKRLLGVKQCSQNDFIYGEYQLPIPFLTWALFLRLVDHLA